MNTRLSAYRGRLLAAVLLLSAAPSICAEGVYESVELRKREPHDLMETSAQFHAQFERRSLLYADEGTVELVREIGYALAPPPTDDYIDYQFYVLRDPSPNAFAMPNGAIYVHTGMLARLEDSSQLAALLAHEINHVAGHHGIVQHRITAKKLFIDMFGGGFASLMSQLSLSRELEQEADDRAAFVLRESSYDPHALPELFELLAQDFEGLRPRVATIWTTHPDPDLRALTSSRLVSAMPSRDRDSEAFDAVVFPIRAITLRDYVQDDFPYTAIALAAELIERYPHELEFRVLLGDAWQALGARDEFAPEDFSDKDKRRNLRQRMVRTRSERESKLLETEAGQLAYTTNLAVAQQTYLDIVDLDPTYAPPYRGLGEVAEKLGLPREAGRHYLEYVRRAPKSADRPVIVGRLKTIMETLTKEGSADAGH